MRPDTKSFVRNLRRNQTDAEARLWHRLRNRQLCGRKFRRQFAIGSYIADFACIESKLVIELDGGQHAENARHDEARTRHLEACGFLVLRFWNADVLTETDAVLATIHSVLEPEAYAPG